MSGTDNLEPLEEGTQGIEGIMTLFESAGLVPLLKPIVDITKNWDLDMSKSLEDYIQFLREYDAESTNFPIAATILQNSSNIYSKKVDFVHAITMQLLEQLRSKNSGKKNSDNKEDADEDEDQEGMGVQSKKKKKTNNLAHSEEMLPLENIMSDKCLDITDFESELANQQQLDYLIPNTAIKLKPKPGTTINISTKRNEILGQKHEFRLHWCLSNDGILSEDVDFGNTNVIVEQPRHHDNTIFEIPQNIDDVDEPNDDDMWNDPMHDKDIDSIEERGVAELQKPTKRQKENLINKGEINYWRQRATPGNSKETPINRKKCKIIPQEVDNERQNERGWNYDIIKYIKPKGLQEECEYYSDEEPSDLVKAKRQLLQQKRQSNAKEAKKNINEVYPGYMEEEEEENDLNEDFDFPDFNEEESDDDICDNVDIDIPLPSQDLFTQNTGNTQEGGETYEDVARKALQNFRTEKQNYESRMTEISKRVAAWHQSILPKLEEAEERSHFDIHEYGSRILNKFPKSDGKFTMSFKKLVENEKREDISRLFLSSLMLANTSNIEITKSDPTDDLAADCMNLTLLSRARHHDELDDNIRATSNKNCDKSDEKLP